MIVGAGSAGCVLADRLSEDGARVLLLEAGPTDWYPWIHVPAGVLKLLRNPLVNWNYASEPEAGTGNRAIHWPRGRVLGGSSSINGMLFIRGNPGDYDGWAQRGCTGWSYDDVLPYFRRLERYAPGDPKVRGRDGPLPVEDYRTVLPLTHRFVEAAQAAGFAFTEDLNGRRNEGVGYSQMSRNGRFRGSTARTFLARARRRPNLRVETGAVATRLAFDGRRCTGVAFRQGGRDRLATAAREVILSGGSVNSPHLLQVSGIGPAEHLREIGVEVRHDLPGVGGNLSDHYSVRIVHRVKDAISTNQLARMPRLAGQVARWLTVGDGALTFGITTAQVFCTSRDGVERPDIQILFTPCSYAQHNNLELEREPGMTVNVSIARPESRGSIMARSADPLERPVIRPNYLSAPNDVRVAVAGLHIARRILAADPLARHSAGEVLPGPPSTGDADLAAYVRETGSTVFHPCGTCAMGMADDARAVVDPRLRVRGLEALRVVDASIMPQVTTSNTNATTIMIAEKAADMIREDARVA